MSMEARSIADDLAALSITVRNKEHADKEHMKEMHEDYDRQFFKLNKRLNQLEEDRKREAEQAAAVFADIVHRLQFLEDRMDPPPGSQGYRNLDAELSGVSLDANPARSSIVDEVFNGRK